MGRWRTEEEIAQSQQQTQGSVPNELPPLLVKRDPPKPRPIERPQEKEYEAVVDELPQIPTRKIRGEDGKIYNLTTRNDAMKEILEGVRELLRRGETLDD